MENSGRKGSEVTREETRRTLRSLTHFCSLVVIVVFFILRVICGKRCGEEGKEL